jgi:hypothetical protein
MKYASHWHIWRYAWHVPNQLKVSLMNRRSFLSFLLIAPCNAAWSQPTTPNSEEFTKAALRNRIRVELNAPVADVWALVGNVARFPEYSSGLDTVVPKTDADGKLTEYTCHFKPMQDGVEGLVHREFFRWYSLNQGWATSAEEPNAFGLRNSLTMVRLAQHASATALSFDQYYDAESLPAMRSEFDRALTDIADNLVRKFGGRIVEKFVDGPM